MTAAVDAANEPAISWSQDQFDQQFRRPRIEPRWLPNGKGFWYYRGQQGDHYEYVLVNATTGKVKTGMDSAELGLPSPRNVRTSLLRPEKEERSEDGGQECTMTLINRLKHPVNISWIDRNGEEVKFGSISSGVSRVQRTFEGHLWLATDVSGKLIAKFAAHPLRTHVTIDGPSRKSPRPQSSLHEPPPPGTSPDQNWQARRSSRKILLENLKRKETVELSIPGDPEAKFFGKIEWSPRSDAFVVSMTVPVKTRQITIGKSLAEDRPDANPRTINYAKPGDPLPQPMPVLFRMHDQKFEPLIIDAGLFSNQFSESNSHDYVWAKDGSEFYFGYNQRGHQLYRILAVNARTGEVRTVVEETAKTFIDYRKKTWRHWLSSSKEVLWLSERSGWCHLWSFDVTGKLPPRQLTAGDWVVHEVVRVDELTKMVWFTASGLRPDEDPYHVHLCRVRLDGSGFLQLTEGDGDHEIEFSPDGSLFVDTWSRVDHPPVTELRRSSSGELVCEVAGDDEKQRAQLGSALPERFVAKGRDGRTDIYGIIVKPSNFDPAKSYPILEDLYAGPHSAFCPKKFGTHGRLQSIAELGFVVVKADGMGTNFRGKAFHDVCWKNLKDAGFPDRIAWIRAAAKTRPWMDLARVGVIGGSAGGQSAMRALLDHSDFYHVAVADCGCHDNRIDKIWWNEQWMGWPIDDSYARSSNVDDAAKLKGQLLLIVGEEDENVDPDSTMQVIAALKKAGKTFDFCPLPKTGHSAAETTAGSRIRSDFLIRHLRAGGL